jgi:hypothetical protein
LWGQPVGNRWLPPAGLGFTCQNQERGLASILSILRGRQSTATDPEYRRRVAGDQCGKSRFFTICVPGKQPDHNCETDNQDRLLPILEANSQEYSPQQGDFAHS